MRFLLGITFGLATTLLASCASTERPAPSRQAITNQGCIQVQKPEGPITLCPRYVESRSVVGDKRGFCEFYLKIDEKGKVKDVDVFRAKPRATLESYCMSTAYRWKFKAPRDAAGNITTVDNVYARLEITPGKDDIASPITRPVYVFIHFDSTKYGL